MSVTAAFDFTGVTLPLTALRPIRQIKPADAAFGKYRSILASIREVGVIEPLVVWPEPNATGFYFLLDGHLRLQALQDLKRTEAFCLVAKDNDVLTYNNQVNRLSVIQEHAMILRALQQGLTPAQIAQALDLDPARLKAKVNLLDGIHPTAVELLQDRPITAGGLRLFRRVKPPRQVEMAKLMRAGDNYTCAYAQALVIGSRPEQLSGPRPPELVRGLSPDQVARMEREMESLEQELRMHQDRCGENSLHLNAAHRYVQRLLANPRIERFLAQR
jgi:hypothetical protein